MTVGARRFLVMVAVLVALALPFLHGGEAAGVLAEGALAKGALERVLDAPSAGCPDGAVPCEADSLDEGDDDPRGTELLPAPAAVHASPSPRGTGDVLTLRRHVPPDFSPLAPPPRRTGEG